MTTPVLPGVDLPPTYFGLLLLKLYFIQKFQVHGGLQKLNEDVRKHVFVSTSNDDIAFN